MTHVTGKSVRDYIGSLTGLPEGQWQTNADLSYLAARAEDFAAGRASYARRAAESLLARVGHRVRLEGLGLRLDELAELAGACDSPESDVRTAQAIEIVAGDWLLLEEMEEGGAPARVLDELRSSLLAEALDVASRLLRNALQQVQAFRAHTPLDEHKVETLGRRYERDFADSTLEPTPFGSEARVHLVLNGGRGTRLRTTIPKGIIYLGGRPMLEYALEAGRNAGCSHTVVVLGYRRRENEPFLPPGTSVVEQRPVDGTGHALLCAQDVLRDFRGTLLVSYTDMPFIRTSTLQALIAEHEASAAAMTLLTTDATDHPGFARILHDCTGKPLRLAQPRVEEVASDLADAGFYCLRSADIWPLLHRLENRNHRYEYYLTDLVEQCHRAGCLVRTRPTAEPIETLGINCPKELIQAREHLFRQQLLAQKSFALPAPLSGDRGVAAYAAAKYYETRGGPDVDGALRRCASEAEALALLEGIVSHAHAAREVNIGPLFLLGPQSSLVDTHALGTDPATR